ncbi:MAG: FHA domain-containing protein [Proteobacteria bacterium]|nr:FHA domain-containing protein [Pseudomonadota bacterium]
MARVSIISNGKLVRSIELGAGEMVIGRGDDVSIQLKHPLISRKHARLYLTPAGYIIEDSGTKNGTFVAGRRIQRHRLDDGDEMEVADFILQYHAEGFVPIDAEMAVGDPAWMSGGGGGGMVAKDRQKSPLEAYMEALKQGGTNATAAIPPEAMARLRDQARKKATPRLQVDQGEPIAMENRVTVVGWGPGNDIPLPGRWIWVGEAARITNEDLELTVEKLSFWCPVKVNGKKIKGATKVEVGGRIRVGKCVLVMHEGEAGF